MQVISLKNTSVSLYNIYHALNGFYHKARALLFNADTRAGNDARRKAENGRERHIAQGLAATWQGPRYWR